mmetsp:Transcript_4682/g.8956  ORF Transcript_4682/g.8956 Transcript_4682/m.8956 type:complete len:274 (-) Transcript_4682:734-1555(-)
MCLLCGATSGRLDLTNCAGCAADVGGGGEDVADQDRNVVFSGSDVVPSLLGDERDPPRSGRLVRNVGHPLGDLHAREDVPDSVRAENEPRRFAVLYLHALDLRNSDAAPGSVSVAEASCDGQGGSVGAREQAPGALLGAVCGDPLGYEAAAPGIKRRGFLIGESPSQLGRVRSRRLLRVPHVDTLLPVSIPSLHGDVLQVAVVRVRPARPGLWKTALVHLQLVEKAPALDGDVLRVPGAGALGGSGLSCRTLALVRARISGLSEIELRGGSGI